MKFLVVLALAVCLPAIVSSYECDGCDLSGTWRTWLRDYENNDDELIAQTFDGQVEWREEYGQFEADYNDWVANGKGSGSRQDQARQSCKEAIPDRVYGYRFEREIDDEDNYEVRFYLYRGFAPKPEAWDRYCRLLIDEDKNNMVEAMGRSIDDLKGAISAVTRGVIVARGGNACNVDFRPNYISQNCLQKNDNKRYPTERFCSGVQTGAYDLGRWAIGGSRAHARYGCDQYTWDSDSNDDNIEQTCDRMYFINTYNEQNQNKPGQILGLTAIQPLANVVTPDDDLCEYRVRNNGWGDFTGISNHPCQ